MPDPTWLTALIPFVKDVKTWEILKEHVALLTAQRDEVIRELDKSDAALAKTKEEIARLNGQIDDLKKEVARLTPASDLPHESLQILQYLFADDRMLTARDFAQIFEVEIGIAKYHCDKLYEMKFVNRHRRALTGRDTPDEFSISTQGRAYLVESGQTWKDPENS